MRPLGPSLLGNMQTRRVNVNTMVTSGFAENTRKRDIEKAGRDWRDELIGLLANLFSNEKVAGGKLEPNDAAYTAWKVKHGYSPKRGHLTNHTQDILNKGSFFEVKVTGSRGSYRCVVTASRKKFYKLVGGGFPGYRSYIERYEQVKAPNETITAFKQGWTRYGNKHFKHLAE